MKPKPMYTGDMSKLDAEGRSLISRASDLQARKLLLDRAEALYDGGQKRAACVLIHALEYLTDRLAYQLYPWPKDCILVDFGVEKGAGK